MYDLYKSWEEASCHDFVSFWNGAGIEDEEVLVLLPHVKSTEVVFFGSLLYFCNLVQRRNSFYVVVLCL